MSYVTDPQLENAKILAKYAQTREPSLKKDVLKIIGEIHSGVTPLVKLANGPFQSEEQAERSVVEAGKAIANLKLAGTVFGNVSTLFEDTIYISATGSRLEALENSLVKCDLEGRPLNGLQPSSEFPSHLRIVKETGSKCVLHAHPFFTVVYSLLKGINGTMFGVPVVGGDVGGGETGIVHTVPPVLRDFNIVAVHAHGVFAVDAFDFNAPLKNIYKLEALCRKRYVEQYL